MPEGDTIHTLAAALRPELVGRRLVGGRVRGREDERLCGRAIEGVAARGKHLFCELGARSEADGPLVLRSHLGLHGSWHRYRPGEAWTAGRAAGRTRLRDRRRAAVVLETESRVYVCFDAKEVDVLAAGDVERFARARRLGPDLVLEVPDIERVLERSARFVPAHAPLVDLLLDQRVACGIGNVLASETLHAAGRHPRECVGALTPRDVGALFRCAHRLLRANVGPGPRVTRARDGRGPLAVYGRAGAPCRTCAAPIVSARLGRGRRVTAWCETCQPLVGPAATTYGGLDAARPPSQDDRT